MTAGVKPPTDSTLVWERPEPEQRPVLEPLSRERIVRAAILIADAEGLAAVSLRKVAAALNAGPMRLYGYMSTKEELLELMVDAVYGEMSAEGVIRSDFREALRAIAQRMRMAAAAHSWLIELLNGRPHLGPNALAYLEASLAAVHATPGFEDIDAVMQAVRTVHAYVVGAIRSAATALPSALGDGMDQAQWQAATGPYMQRMIATGRFPTLAKVFHEATHPPPDVVFDVGLECLLDGIAARFAR
jgi:AcrR family transcriptional regulator